MWAHLETREVNSGREMSPLAKDIVLFLAAKINPKLHLWGSSDEMSNVPGIQYPGK